MQENKEVKTEVQESLVLECEAVQQVEKGFDKTATIDSLELRKFECGLDKEGNPKILTYLDIWYFVDKDQQQIKDDFNYKLTPKTKLGKFVEQFGFVLTPGLKIPFKDFVGKKVLLDIGSDPKNPIYTKVLSCKPAPSGVASQ